MNRRNQWALTLGLTWGLACQSANGPGTVTGGATTAGTGGAVVGETGGGGPAAGGTSSSTGGDSTAGAPPSTSGSGGTSASDGGASSGGASPTETGGSETSGGASNGAGGSTAGSSGASNLGGETSSAGQAGASNGGSTAVWSETFPTFTKNEISSFQSGYAMVVVDVDGDELPDVVALSSGATGLAWFKNPEWERFAITTDTERYIHLAPHDVDGDGDSDLGIASEFNFSDSTAGGTVYWAEAPEDPTTTTDWAIHPIDAIPTSHRLRWGDIDGDGAKELLNLPIFGEGSTAPEHAGTVALTAYTIPADPTGAWEATLLDDTRLEVAHGINVVDWDGDAAEDVLTAANAGVHLFRPSLGEEPVQLAEGAPGAAPDRGSSEICLGSLGGARFFSTIEPWHGTDTVVYAPGTTSSILWNREVLGADDFAHGHAMATADLNGDGYDEIVSAGGEGSMALLVYRYLPSDGSWERIELDSGETAFSEIDVEDMNGDGALDIVAIGSGDVVWFENTP